MRSFVIWSVVLWAIAETACNKEPKPLEQGKTPQEAMQDTAQKPPAMPPGKEDLKSQNLKSRISLAD